MSILGQQSNHVLRKAGALIVLVTFLLNTILPANAQNVLNLPAPGARVGLSPEFTPPILKGIKVYPDNPFRFDFILDKGDSHLTDEAIKDESARLIKYFLASLTVPEKDLWVNLSPYEKDRIVPDAFGKTEMGRDLLAEDYLLKQITASLIYPEDETGKKFWKRVYEEAQKKFGTTDIPVNTFNKVWIVPEKAVVYENAQAGTAYVVESKLKVMLEEDYLALERNKGDGRWGIGDGNSSNTRNPTPNTQDNVNTLGSQIVREIVIPLLEKEVNEGKNFAQLRQVYQSLILAAWYKKKIKDSILHQIYIDKKKLVGVDVDDKEVSKKIWGQYVQAFKKGVYNYIKEDYDPVTQETIPRKYFSGGVQLQLDAAMLGTNMETRSVLEVTDDPKGVPVHSNTDFFKIPIFVQSAGSPTSLAMMPQGFKSEMATSIPNDNGTFKNRQTKGSDDSPQEGKYTDGLVMDLGDAPTPRRKSERSNQFFEFLAKTKNKTVEQYEKQNDEKVLIDHFRLLHHFGFIKPSGDSKNQEDIIHRIFATVDVGYKKYAQSLHQPYFERKLFIVDSPEVNAFVYPQREDVYIYVGLIRELANFCLINKIDFTEDMIAAVFAHELAHVLQSSSYQGINAEIVKGSVGHSELLDLKRQAEYDADKGAAFILSAAGYDSNVIGTLMGFLKRIEHRTAAEVAIQSHPHPSERGSNAEMFFEDESLVLEEEKIPVSLDTHKFLNWQAKHLGQKATEIHSYADIIRLLNEAKTLTEVVELARIARYMKGRVPLLRLTKRTEVRTALARDIYIHNVADAMNLLINQQLGTTTYPETQFFSTEQGYEGREREGLLLKWMTSNENLGTVSQSFNEEGFLKQINTGARREFFPSERLQNFYSETKHSVYDLSLPIDKKLRLIKILDEMYVRAKQKLESDAFNGDALARYEQSSRTSADANGVVEQIALGNIEAMDALEEQPLCFYSVYGLPSLSSEEDIQTFMGSYGVDFLKRGGIDPSKLELGKVNFERATSDFYQKDVNLIPVDSSEQRRNMFEVLMVAMLDKRVGDQNLPQEDENAEVNQAINNAVQRTVALTDLPVDSKYGLNQAEFSSWLNHLLQNGIRYRNLQNNRSWQYFRTLVPNPGTDIFSGIFDRELGGNQYLFKDRDQLFPKEAAAEHSNSQPIDLEINNDAPAAVRRIKGGEHIPWNEAKKNIREELSRYSSSFRVQMLERIFITGSMQLPVKLVLPQDMRDIMEGLVFPYDQFTILWKVMRAWRLNNIIDSSDEELNHIAQTMDWIIDNKPGSIPDLGEVFCKFYLDVQMLQIKRASDQGRDILTKDRAFNIMEKLSRAGTISLHKDSDVIETDKDADNFILNQIGSKTKAELDEEITKNGRAARAIPSAQVPVNFIGRSDMEWNAVLQQKLFRMLFDLDRIQLQTIANHQQKIRFDSSPKARSFSANE